MASTDPTITAALMTDTDSILGIFASEYHLSEDQVTRAIDSYVSAVRDAIAASHPEATIRVTRGAYQDHIALDGEDITELFGHVWSDWLKSDSLGAILGDNN